MILQTRTNDGKWISVSENITDITRFLAYLSTVRESVKRNGRILFLGDPIDPLGDFSGATRGSNIIEFQ